MHSLVRFLGVFCAITVSLGFVGSFGLFFRLFSGFVGSFLLTQFILPILPAPTTQLDGFFISSLSHPQPTKFVNGAVDTSVTPPPAIDYVWLCTSSTQLREDDGAWLFDAQHGLLAPHSELRTALPLSPTWVLVLMTPGMKDYDFVIQKDATLVGRVINGLIGMAAYQAPLKKEKFSPTHPNSADRTQAEQQATPTPGLNYGDGIAFVCAGPQKSLLFGAEPHATLLAGYLNQSGVSCRSVNFDPKSASLGLVLTMQTTLLGLQLNDWSLHAFASSPQLDHCIQSVQQSAFSLFTLQGRKVPSAISVLYSKWFIRLVIFFTQFIGPFDVEKMIEYHFMKVNDQTVFMMKQYIRMVEEHNQTVKESEYHQLPELTHLKGLVSAVEKKATNK